MTKKRRAYEKKPAVGAFGQKLRASRLEHNLTGKELAEMLYGTPGRYPEISRWEIGKGKPNQELLDKLAQIFDWDSTPIIDNIPRATPPVSVTKGLRVALSTPEDEFAYRPTKIKHSISYLSETIPILLNKLDAAHREIHRLEQDRGITGDQLALLREKAGNWDKLEEMRAKKGI